MSKGRSLQEVWVVGGGKFNPLLYQNNKRFRDYNSYDVRGPLPTEEIYHHADDARLLESGRVRKTEAGDDRLVEG